MRLPKRMNVLVNSSYLDAYASNDGITISSTEFNGTQKISAKVYYNKEGEIETKILNQSIDVTHKEYLEQNPELNKYLNKVVHVSWVVALAILLVITAFGNTMVTTCALVFLVFALLTKAYTDVPNYIADIFFARKNLSLSRYHSAEHMTAKARRRNDHVPTMDEVLAESRYDTTCTTVASIYFMLTSLVNTIALTISSIIMTVLFINFYPTAESPIVRLLIVIIVLAFILALKYLLKAVSFAISKLLRKEWFVMIFQWPLLASPTKRELDLAIHAYKTQYKIDRTILRNFECYETVAYSFDVKSKAVIYEMADGKMYKGSFDEYIKYVTDLSKMNVSPENEQKEDLSG